MFGILSNILKGSFLSLSFEVGGSRMSRSPTGRVTLCGAQIWNGHMNRKRLIFD